METRMRRRDVVTAAAVISVVAVSAAISFLLIMIGVADWIREL